MGVFAIGVLSLEARNLFGGKRKLDGGSEQRGSAADRWLSRVANLWLARSRSTGGRLAPAASHPKAEHKTSSTYKRPSKLDLDLRSIGADHFS